MNNYLADEQERARRLKRDGCATFLSLSDEDIEARLKRELAVPGQPESDYDRLWAVTLLDLAVAQLRTEYEADGNDGEDAMLLPFLKKHAE